MSQDVGKLRCQIAQATLYLQQFISSQLSVQSASPSHIHSIIIQDPSGHVSCPVSVQSMKKKWLNWIYFNKFIINMIFSISDWSSSQDSHICLKASGRMTYSDNWWHGIGRISIYLLNTYSKLMWKYESGWYDIISPVWPTDMKLLAWVSSYVSFTSGFIVYAKCVIFLPSINK
jgi:hypothetical protein